MRVALADAAASKHYVNPNQEKYCKIGTRIHNPPIIRSANGNVLEATHKTTIILPKELSTIAKEGYILPKLSTNTLISIGQLCDDKCIATFDAMSVKISKNNKIILEGSRDSKTGMWHMPLNNNGNTAI